jgi:hypothetical protein
MYGIFNKDWKGKTGNTRVFKRQPLTQDQIIAMN